MAIGSILYDIGGKEYQLLEKMVNDNTTGEGIIYLTANNQVIKIFKEDIIDKKAKQKKIQRIIAGKYAFPGICFPLKELFDKKENFVGYLMPRSSGIHLENSLFSKEFIQDKFPLWNRVQLCDVCLSILEKISYLHENDILIGDVNPANIQVDYKANVWFVDTDSYQIEGIPSGVGKPLFTPPELQGQPFGKLIRTRENEYYSIATLLFMIFLPGKPPYAYIGGGSLKQNLIVKNFSYPFAKNDNNKTPRGDWEIIWNELGYFVKKTFYDVFKNNLRIGVKKWNLILLNYKSELLNGLYPTSIFPNANSIVIQSEKALSLNKGDISDRFIELRKDKTILSNKNVFRQIGVLELSSKAIKLLIGDDEIIKNKGFDFSYFPIRKSEYSNTGLGMNSDGYMDMNYFRSKIIPLIISRLDLAKANGVQTLYCVATAAYRSAKNRKDIIMAIRKECGINVKILDKKEEAIATIRAFLFSKPINFSFESNKNYLMIDQGGGSTEVSVFRGQEMIDTFSVDLGSIPLKNILFNEATNNTSFDAAFEDSARMIKDTFRPYLRNRNFKDLADKCISVGNAIIEATEAKNAWDKHGKVLTIEEIKIKILEFDNQIRSNFKNLQELSEAIDINSSQQREKEKKSRQVDNILVARISLPIYVEIMEYYKISSVVVSNTGLWYGIYFEKLFST